MFLLNTKVLILLGWTRFRSTYFHNFYAVHSTTHVSALSSK